MWLHGNNLGSVNSSKHTGHSVNSDMFGLNSNDYFLNAPQGFQNTSTGNVFANNRFLLHMCVEECDK